MVLYASRYNIAFKRVALLDRCAIVWILGKSDLEETKMNNELIDDLRWYKGIQMYLLFKHLVSQVFLLS